MHLEMKIRIDAKSTHSAVIVMQRTFDGPRALVWAVLTDPKHVARWYGGRGFENPLCEMDVRPGGRWQHRMKTPDGVEHALEFEFGEVLEPEKLTWKNSDIRMAVTLEADAQSTNWKLVARFNTYAERDAAQKVGFASVLAEGTEKFNALVKGLVLAAPTQRSRS
jgi:uncharacterized protein YndB with AHSA1/START domain